MITTTYLLPVNINIVVNYMSGDYINHNIYIEDKNHNIITKMVMRTDDTDIPFIIKDLLSSQGEMKSYSQMYGVELACEIIKEINEHGVRLSADAIHTILIEYATLFRSLYKKCDYKRYMIDQKLFKDGYNIYIDDNNNTTIEKENI